MARHRAGNRPNKIIRFDSSKPQYPPSYQSWLVLNEKQNKQAEKLVKFKRRKVELDKNLDAELRLSEINVLFELASDKNYKIPKDALCRLLVHFTSLIWAVSSHIGLLNRLDLIDETQILNRYISKNL